MRKRICCVYTRRLSCCSRLVPRSETTRCYKRILLRLWFWWNQNRSEVLISSDFHQNVSIDSFAEFLDTDEGILLGRNTEELADLVILVITVRHKRDFIWYFDKLAGILPLAIGLLASFSVFMSIKMNSSCCKFLSAILSVISSILYFIVMGISIAMLVVIFSPAVRGMLDETLR